MPADALPVFNSMGVSVMLIALGLLIGVGFRTSGLRTWIAALLWQSLAWGLLSASLWIPTCQTLLSAFGSCALVASVSCMYLTASHYLALPHARAWSYAPPIFAIAACVLLIHHDALRFATVNLTICIQTAWIAWLLTPKSLEERSERWRWLALVAYAVFTLGMVLSIAINFVAPPHLAVHTTPAWLDSVALAVNTGWPMICTLAFLLAHRDEAEQALTRLASQDGLTGLLNRRAFMERASEALAVANSRGQSFSILMLDIDYFKSINDGHGHQMGDAVLATFAEALMRCVRSGDLIGRYGGEEFCVMLREATVADARVVDDRVRRRLATKSMELHGFPIDFSGGLAHRRPNQQETLSQLIGRSDRALYSAKHSGRGCLVVDD